MERKWFRDHSHETVARERRVPMTSVDSDVATAMRLLREALKGGSEP